MGRKKLTLQKRTMSWLSNDELFKIRDNNIYSGDTRRKAGLILRERRVHG